MVKTKRTLSDSDKLRAQLQGWFTALEQACEDDVAIDAAEHFKPGRYTNIPREVYEAIPAMNATTIKAMETQSPAHARYWQEEEKGSDELLFGEGFHCACLEPGEFPKRFVLWPDAKQGDAPTKKTKDPDMRPGGRRAGKAWDSFCASHLPRKAVRERDYNDIQSMSEQLHSHPALMPLLQRRPIFFEVTLIWVDPHTGMLCKARFDVLIDDENPTGLDYKTTNNAKPSRFGTQVFDFGYDIGAAHYCMGQRVLNPDKPLPNMIIPAIEKKPPFKPVIYRVGIATMRLGWMRTRSGMDRYAECLKTDRWPGYGDDKIIDVDAPTWALRQYNIKLPEGD